MLRRLLSRKEYGISLIVFLLLILSIGSYTAINIYLNVKKMQAPQEEGTLYFPDYPSVNTTGKDATLIKRGEYLVKAGDCIACHTNTPQRGKAFAGGLPMLTPFGTIYAPNITPDKNTGIGNWTEAEFIKAMRHGISPKNTYYYPAFPYLYFSKIKTEDLQAIKAYLDSIPPVSQINLENKMVFPFNIRFLQLGWRLLFFHEEDTKPYQPNPNQSEQWNQGAYLVKGLGHCAMCHTPSYNLLTEAMPLGAPIHKYDLVGSKIQGYLAPDITRRNLEKISDQEVVDVFAKDRLIGGGKVLGPMLEVNHDSLRYLSRTDLFSITGYLKTVKSETPPKPKGGPGKGTYESSCSGCHATGSGGSPKFGDAVSWEPIIKRGLDKALYNAIHGINNMPAKGSCLSCTDDEIKEALVYMFAAASGGNGKLVMQTKRKTRTMADGRRLYKQNCSVCHDCRFKNAPKPGDMARWKPIIDRGFISAYQTVVNGQNAHPMRGACPNCTDGEIKAAVKYMMQASSKENNYSLW